MLFIVALGVIFKGAPFAYDFYQQGKADIVDFKDKRERLKQLILRKDFWQLEYNKSLKQKSVWNKELFSAKSNELVAAKVQSMIKQMAKQTGVNVESMRLAEFQQSNDWLLVSLSVTIRAKSDNVMNFITRVRSNQQKLLIKSMSIRSNRNTLSGTITMVGFSKAIGNNSDAKKET